MALSRVVSYYRQKDTVVVRVKPGKIKFFSPTFSSQRRLSKVLESLDREGRCDLSVAWIYGGGLHCFIDPRWLRMRSGT